MLFSEIRKKYSEKYSKSQLKVGKNLKEGIYIQVLVLMVFLNQLLIMIMWF